MSEGSLRRFTAASLLALMALLCLPRSVVHDCDRWAGHHGTHSGGVVGADDHCPICEQAIAPMLAIDGVHGVDPTAPVIGFLGGVSTGLDAVFHGRPSTRGPPLTA